MRPQDRTQMQGRSAFGEWQMANSKWTSPSPRPSPVRWHQTAVPDRTVQRTGRTSALRSRCLGILPALCLLTLALAARSQTPLDTDQCPDVTETEQLGINGQPEIRLHICRMTNGMVLNWKAQPGET